MGFTVLDSLDLDDISSLQYSVNYLLCCSLNRLSSQGNPYQHLLSCLCKLCKVFMYLVSM